MTHLKYLYMSIDCDFLLVSINMTDEPKGIPLTMRAYQMQGTPTLILIDKTGHIRLHKFGHVSDLTIGFSIGALLSEEIDESPAR